LGLITDEVYELRDALQFPGMRVMQYGFADREDNYHRPDAYPAHCVAYTGTHDNETVMSWYGSQIEHSVFQELIQPYVSSPENIHLQLIRAVLASQAETALIPIQDLLGLGDEGKMNTPGEATGNWAWRLAPEQLTPTHAVQLKLVTKETGRIDC
jgi:4-alpha-glucanotransferase